MTAWRAGMPAVCIDDRWHEQKSFFRFRWLARSTGPSQRQIVRVADTGSFGGMLFLALEDFPDSWFDARGFRPLADDQSDPELVARIKRCKPASLPVRAGSAPTLAPGASAQPVHDAARSNSNRFSPFHFEDAE